MFGYGGKILTVDVTSGEQRIEEFDAAFARAYLGGNGFAAKLCYDRIPPGIDPFDPGNLVVFATGPVTDSVIPGNNRNCVAGKSPLNGLFFDSTFGGRFAGTQRHTGFDAIAITGTSPEPVYLVVDEGGVRLTPAKELWGRPTLQTAQAILDREGWDSDVVSIGPAGERRVRIAALAHYWKNREAFGARGGLAAVLGSKQVKAVVVRGSRKAQFADPDLLKALVNETREALKKGTANLHVFGTPNLVKGINAIGGLGFFNNRFEYSPDAEQVGGERYKAEFHKKDTTCNKCPVACGKTFEVKAGEYAGTVWKMPEYETIYAFGPMLGNLDPASLIKAEELCDQLGLDTISMGVTIAFVLECLERGFLTEREVGVPVGWGNHQAVHRLVEMTARREGFGDVLAEGSARLADRLGPEARKFLHAVKGLEMPAHSARALKGMSIGYATGTRGGSHHDARPTAQYAPDFDRRNPEGKAAWAIRSQNFTGRAGTDRRADLHPGTRLQRPRGRLPEGRHAPLAGPARAHPGRSLQGHLLPSRGAGPDARGVLRVAGLVQGRHPDPGEAPRPRPRIRRPALISPRSPGAGGFSASRSPPPAMHPGCRPGIVVVRATETPFGRLLPDGVKIATRTTHLTCIALPRQTVLPGKSP
ncbi:MAG: aldehyde ferredoxin oxidoreductase family protein [candidate division NC10 bacterium]|nr:aldehyde ferredoxin oxidoreductase family protein [candidate division NC10 bacterium]